MDLYDGESIQSLISVVQKLEKGWKIWRYRNTKGPDGDLQALLCNITKQLRDSDIQHETDWVKGHQDDDPNPTVLSRQAMLNVQMDGDAKDAYDFPPAWLTEERVPVFEAEVCAVFIKDVKITSSIHMSLAEHWHDREAKAYLLKRHNIDTSVFQTVHWPSLRFAFKKLSAHRRATAVKALHRHLPSQDKFFKQGRITMSALCPRCLQESETNAHVFCCSNERLLSKGN